MMTPIVNVAHGVAGLAGSVAGVVAAGCGLREPPAVLDFANFIALGAPETGVRVTEMYATAFERRGGSASATNGTRIRVKLTGVPAGARLFAPDAIAGSNAAVPTAASAMGISTSAGVYTPEGTHTLLLGRVNAPLSDGSGGVLAAARPSALTLLSSAGEVTVTNGTAYLVYEVLDASETEMESAQIPVWLCLSTTYQVAATRISTTINLAPLSTLEGAVAAAPIPRYREATVGSDCELLSDCSAGYWPSLIASGSPASFTLPSNGGTRTGYVSVRNSGGGILDWQAKVSYRSATGWITTYSTIGSGNSTFRYDVSSKNLGIGHYEADLVFQQVNSPNGVNTSKTITVSLDVTAAPVVDPTPVIDSIVSPDTGWNMPAAPGSIVLVRGSNLTASTVFTVGGKTALVTAVGTSDVTLEIPSDAAPGGQNVVATNGTSVGRAYYFTIQSVAPAVILMLNDDGSRNADGEPMPTGGTIQLYTTGIRQASAVELRLHDRVLTPSIEATTGVGVDLLKASVPADLPTMQTALQVCGKTSAGDTYCSHPKNVWLRQQQP
jgi:hypothetical protein